jgi:hypothetical protein
MRDAVVHGHEVGVARRWDHARSTGTMRTSTGARRAGIAGPEGRRVMSAQTPYLEVDAVGVFPTLLLAMVVALAILGVIAHVAFA